MSFIKILFFFIILSSYLHALNIKNLGIAVYLISEEKEQKILKQRYKKKELHDYKLKITVNKDLIKEETYYLKIRCEAENIFKSNIAYKRDINNIILKINKTSPKEIYLSFKNEDKKTLDILINPIHSFEFENIYEYRNVIAGISYGIIFCAFLYSFIIYLNTHFRSLLYYGLMQLFLVITLLQSHYFSTKTYDFVKEEMITDYLVNLTIIMIILFSKEVLLFKKYYNIFNKVFKIMLLLILLDISLIYFTTNTSIYDFIPIYIFIFILVILASISAFQGHKFSFFYIVGWLVVFVSLIITQYNLFYLNDSIVLNIGFPLESLILSLALGYKLKNIMKEKKEKEKLLVQQSKLAAMGNMINNIAHQWRQPLTNLSFINMDLQMAIKTNDVNDKYLHTIINDSTEQIDFMSKTLDNFKGFYQPNKQSKEFLISKAIYQAINIIKPTLKDNNIKLKIKIKDDKKINSYENEYSQIVLNILSNAKDALLENKIENPKIKIVLFLDDKENIILRICDNAKGIKEEIIHKIFDPYFSTKESNTGIGLYMSKIIAKSHLNAEITVYNTTLGACFEIKL